jgi:hypothetical protein
MLKLSEERKNPIFDFYIPVVYIGICKHFWAYNKIIIIFNEIDFMSRNLIHKNQLLETFVKTFAKHLITSMEKLECVNY